MPSITTHQLMNLSTIINHLNLIQRGTDLSQPYNAHIQEHIANHVHIAS